MNAAFLLLLLCGLANGATFSFHGSGKIPVVIVTWPDEERDVHNALNIVQKWYEDKHRENKNMFQFNFVRLNWTRQDRDRKNVYDVFKSLCHETNGGFLAIFGRSDSVTFPVLREVSRMFNVPYFDWSLPPRPSLPTTASPSDFRVEREAGLVLGVRPSLHKTVAAKIIRLKWRDAIFVYNHEDSAESLSMLQRVTAEITKVQRCLTCEKEEAWPHLVFQTTLRPINPKYANISELFKQIHANATQCCERVIVHVKDLNNVILFGLNPHAQHQSAQNVHYILIHDDINKMQIDILRNGFWNATTFRLLHRDNEAYHNFVYRNNLKQLSVDAAVAFDSISAFASGLAIAIDLNRELLRGYFRDNIVYSADGNQGFNCDKSSGLRRDFGASIVRALKQNSITGLTGDISFGRNGMRENFTIEMVEVSFVGRMDMGVSSQKSEFWTDGGASAIPARIKSRRKFRAGEYNKKIRIVTMENRPFYMQRENTTANKTEYIGYVVDLTRKLSEIIPNFNYEIHKSDAYGAQLPNGDWNGMIGELLHGTADVIIADVTITRDRELVIQFSKPFMVLGISIMIKKPEEKAFSVFSFMSPLSSEIWMYIVFAYLGVSVVIFLVSRFSPYEWRIDETQNGGFTIANDFSVYNCLWFTSAAFMQQGTDILPRSMAGRIASSAWWFFTMVIVSSYTASLAAFLTLEKMQTPINSVEDLAKQNKIKYGISGGGSTEKFFRDSTVETYRRMYQYMSSQNPSVFVSSYASGISRVRQSQGRYAFLLESSANEYNNQRYPCDTIRVGSNLNSVGYGIATAYGSDLSDSINLAILELQERGELKRLENKWWYDKGECPKGGQDGQDQSLTISKVAGVFYILIGGMIVAFICAAGEFVYRSRIEARKSRRSLMASMRAQLDLSLYGSKSLEREQSIVQQRKPKEGDNNNF